MAEQQTQQQNAVAKRGPIDIDFSQGIVPQSYAEAMQMAALLHKSGLAPKSLDTMEKVAVACFMCLELGRPIMTGIQDIGVINGKAGIYGDAALGHVRASGLLEYIKETETGTPYTDDWTFRCELKRKGAPEPRVGIWTWQDAKRAGVDDPKMRDGRPDTFSPWRRFTRRMMQFKARNFPLRDEFGDVLKGMRLAEDNYDAIDMYATANGSWEPQQPTEAQEGTSAKPEPETEKAFEEFANTIGIVPASDVMGFVEATAKANGITTGEVKAGALEDKERFAGALKKWWEQRKEKEDSQEKKDAPTAENEAFRQEFINLRQAGFSTWVWKNKDRLAEAPEAIRQEAKEKWQKLYPEDPFPLDPEPSTESTTETPIADPSSEEEDWRDEFDIASRWKACFDKNSDLTKSMLTKLGFEGNWKNVPKEQMLDVLASVEGEVMA